MIVVMVAGEGGSVLEALREVKQQLHEHCS